MKLYYLPIARENIEYRPDVVAITVGEQMLIFRTSYNPVADAFFVDILTRDNEPILQGRRLVYGGNLLGNIHDERIPDFSIVPFDPSGSADSEGITWDNFMRDVKPYVPSVVVGDN